MSSWRIGLSVATALGGSASAAVLASVGSSTGSLAALGVLTAVATVFAWIAVAPRPPARVGGALERLDARIHAAEQRREEMRRRAETAGRFREEFVAAVRHELKTPLNAILGFTEVLQNGIDGPLDEQQREDVEAIQEAGKYLSELVEAVLEEWMPDRATPVPMTAVDLGAALRDVARLLEGQAVGKPVAIRVEVDPALPHPLGDPRRLRQVLINLGTNALRATAKGTITLGAQRHPDGVCVVVSDTGAGIPADLLPHLFEEFTQGGTPKSRIGGSGLGLALTRDLVEWHGGRIEVQTAVGRGSTFRVLLPLEPD